MSATRLVSLVRFRNLRTRLTVVYMGLFGLALLLAAVAVVTAVTNSARRVVRDEMTAAGAVYSQLWSARSSQLQQGAGVLAQDYGFREAVATNDEATVRSALDNLRARQGVDGALILGVDGHVTATGLAFDDAALDRLFTGLESGQIESGVLAIDGQAFQVVAAPLIFFPVGRSLPFGNPDLAPGDPHRDAGSGCRGLSPFRLWRGEAAGRSLTHSRCRRGRRLRQPGRLKEL